MADTEVKASSSPGANEAPASSPSTAPGNRWPDVPMRPNHVQPLPTPSSVYQAIADLQRGFEQAARNLEALQGFSFFPEEDLTAWGNIIGGMQAEASLQLLDAVRDRLMNNALYYDRLCWTREKQLEDPDDVLIEAEHRKRELAAEQQRREKGAD